MTGEVENLPISVDVQRYRQTMFISIMVIFWRVIIQELSGVEGCVRSTPNETASTVRNGVDRSIGEIAATTDIPYRARTRLTKLRWRMSLMWHHEYIWTTHAS